MDKAFLQLDFKEEPMEIKEADIPFLSQLQGAFFALTAKECNCSDVKT